MIPVTRPHIPDRKLLLSYLDRIDSSQILTNFGPLHEELTQRLEEYLRVQNLLLVANGTLALQVAYKTLRLEGRVLTTPFSFIATASSLVWEGLEPYFGDIDPQTFNLDVSTLPKNPRDLGVTGILPVHVYGNPCDVEAIQSYASQHDLKVVYDASHAFGVKLHDQSVLTHGDAVTLSFHATKLFHTGEGGAIIFKRREDFETAKRLINFGFDQEKNVTGIGINAKMSEYHASVGLSILQDIPKILEKRQAICSLYRESLEGYVKFQKWAYGSSSLGAYAPVLFESEEALLETMASLCAQGIYPRRYFWPSLESLKLSTVESPSLVHSPKIASRVLCLPTLDTDSAQRVVKAIR